MAASVLVLWVVAAMVTSAPARATVTMTVNASDSGRQMPSTLFGLFFEVPCVVISTC
jgi:hypothetical protein